MRNYSNNSMGCTQSMASAHGFRYYAADSPSNPKALLMGLGATAGTPITEAALDA